MNYIIDRFNEYYELLLNKLFFLYMKISNRYTNIKLL